MPEDVDLSLGDGRGVIHLRRKVDVNFRAAQDRPGTAAPTRFSFQKRVPRKYKNNGLCTYFLNCLSTVTDLALEKERHIPGHGPARYDDHTVSKHSLDYLSFSLLPRE